MFAFVAEEAPGDEGIVAEYRGGMWLPMVGADMARVESLRPLAQSVARSTGLKIKLVRFEKRVELESCCHERER